MARTNTNTGSGPGGSITIGDVVVGGSPKQVLYIDNNGDLYGDTNFIRDSVTLDTLIKTYRLGTSGDEEFGFQTDSSAGGGGVVMFYGKASTQEQASSGISPGPIGWDAVYINNATGIFSSYDVGPDGAQTRGYDGNGHFAIISVSTDGQHIRFNNSNNTFAQNMTMEANVQNYSMKFGDLTGQQNSGYFSYDDSARLLESIVNMPSGRSAIMQASTAVPATGGEGFIWGYTDVNTPNVGALWFSGDATGFGGGIYGNLSQASSLTDQANLFISGEGFVSIGAQDVNNAIYNANLFLSKNFNDITYTDIVNNMQSQFFFGPTIVGTAFQDLSNSINNGFSANLTSANISYSNGNLQNQHLSDANRSLMKYNDVAGSINNRAEVTATEYHVYNYDGFDSLYVDPINYNFFAGDVQGVTTLGNSIYVRSDTGINTITGPLTNFQDKAGTVFSTFNATNRSVAFGDTALAFNQTLFTLDDSTMAIVLYGDNFTIGLNQFTINSTNTVFNAPTSWKVVAGLSNLAAFKTDGNSVAYVGDGDSTGNGTLALVDDNNRLIQLSALHLQFPTLQPFANNAAALAFGLGSGDAYLVSDVVTGSYQVQVVI